MKTPYSKLTIGQVTSIHLKYAEEYGKDLLDTSRPFEERKLEKLVAARHKNKDRQEQEMTSVRMSFLEYMFKHLRELALIIYLAMVNSKNWGPHGEERIRVSFCRTILDIPNNREVTYDDVEKFHREAVFECDRRYGFLPDYTGHCNNFRLNIFGKQTSAADFDDVANELFKLMDMDCFLWATLCPTFGVRFALGELEERYIGQNKIYVMRKEFIRSPQLILSIAAEIYKDSTIIRLDAIKTICFNKYERYYKQSLLAGLFAFRQDDYAAITEGFTKKALAYFEVSNTEEIRNIMDKIILEELDMVIFHEEGHMIAHESMKNDAHNGMEHYYFHWVFPNTDSGSALQEALADWAPQNGSRKGAFARFLEIAGTDAGRATRNIYMYLSDCFFVSKEEEDGEYFGILTNYLVGTAISFILDDGTVDFDRIAAKQEEIFAFFQQCYGDLVDELMETIRNSIYEFEINAFDTKKLDFTALELKIAEMHKRTKSEKPLEELRKNNCFWDNAVGFLESHSPDGWKRYQEVIAKRTISVERELLNLITDGQGERYGNSLRTYIVRRCKDIGIIEKPSVVGMLRMSQKSKKRPLAEKKHFFS